MEPKEPMICFGQQPNGFFPKRYLYAKIATARKLQAGIGGKIVFFYHDSDADYRETITIMRDIRTGQEARLNFLQKNKIQKKYSPLYAKVMPPGWQEDTLRQLPRFVGPELMDIFKSIEKNNAADFCLEMYKKMGLLDGIEVMRSGSREFREAALDLQEFFCDVEYEGEIVRAQNKDGKWVLHEGGGKYLEIPQPSNIEKRQKSAARDQRFAWMQSVIHATHYVTGEGEGQYLNKQGFENVKFVDREKIEEADMAFIDIAINSK